MTPSKHSPATAPHSAAKKLKAAERCEHCGQIKVKAVDSEGKRVPKESYIYFFSQNSKHTQTKQKNTNANKNQIRSDTISPSTHLTRAVSSSPASEMTMDGSDSNSDSSRVFNVNANAYVRLKPIPHVSDNESFKPAEHPGHPLYREGLRKNDFKLGSEC